MKALIGCSRYAATTNDDGWTGEEPSRFESRCHRLRTPDNVDSMRDEALFFAKQCRQRVGLLFDSTVFERAPIRIG